MTLWPAIPDPRAGNIVKVPPVMVEIDLADPDRIRTIGHLVVSEPRPSDPVRIPHRRTMNLETTYGPPTIPNRTIRVSLATSLDRHQSRQQNCIHSIRFCFRSRVVQSRPWLIDQTPFAFAIAARAKDNTASIASASSLLREVLMHSDNISMLVSSATKRSGAEAIKFALACRSISGVSQSAQ